MEDQKKAYHTPKLEDYGEVCELTQAGPANVGSWDGEGYISGFDITGYVCR